MTVCMQPDVMSLIFSIENFTKANEYGIKNKWAHLQDAGTHTKGLRPTSFLSLISDGILIFALPYSSTVCDVGGIMKFYASLWNCP